MLNFFGRLWKLFRTSGSTAETMLHKSVYFGTPYCQPPLLGKDPNRMCNGRFNISKTEQREIKNLFQQIHRHDVKFKCEAPCTTNLYMTRLLDNTIPHARDTLLLLVFDRTLQVTRSTFSIDSQTFLARLGGSVSSGRTLLWILLTLLWASQVLSNH